MLSSFIDDRAGRKKRECSCSELIKVLHLNVGRAMLKWERLPDD